MAAITRRAWLQGAAALAFTSPKWARAVAVATANPQELPRARPPVGARHFTSEAVETAIQRVQKLIPDGSLSTIFENCLPNTLDTTVYPGTSTTSRIRMWSPATSMPCGYATLRRRSGPTSPCQAGRTAAHSARGRDSTPGAHDSARSVCQCVHARSGSMRRSRGRSMIARNITRAWPNANGRLIRCAYRFAWPTAIGSRRTIQLHSTRGGTRQRDDSAYIYRAAAEALAVRTFPARGSPADTVALGFGNPARPNGMIFSMFRPSDDACIFPLFVPANLFAAKLSANWRKVAAHAAQDTALAARASALTDEVAQATARHGA